MSHSNHPRTPAVSVGLSGLGHYLPASVITNRDLVRRGIPVDERWIEEKIGIKTRHRANDDQALSDLATPAALMALRNSRLSASDIDALIVAGDFHDSGGLRSTSTIVARNIGAENVQCYDLRVWSAGSVMGLQLAVALISAGLADRVLVAAAEINTRRVSPTDATSAWFGDGAGAAVVQRCNPGTGVLSTYVAGSDDVGEILTVMAGGSRRALTHAGLDAGEDRIHMDGGPVFKFAVEKMVNSMIAVCDQLGVQPTQLDWIVPHQSNMRIIEKAMDILELPRERAYTNIATVGNTAGPSVLLALSEGIDHGVIEAGDLIATVGYGGGLSWGAQIIRVNRASDFWPLMGGGGRAA